MLEQIQYVSDIYLYPVAQWHSFPGDCQLQAQVLQHALANHFLQWHKSLPQWQHRCSYRISFHPCFPALAWGSNLLYRILPLFLPEQLVFCSELKNLLNDYYKQLNNDTTAQLEFERVNTNMKKLDASNALNDKKWRDLLPVVFQNKCGESLGKEKKAGRVITMPIKTKENLKWFSK